MQMPVFKQGKEVKVVLVTVHSWIEVMVLQSMLYSRNGPEVPKTVSMSACFDKNVQANNRVASDFNSFKILQKIQSEEPQLSPTFENATTLI